MGYVIKPKGVMHAFWNATNEDVDYIELSTGDDSEQFIDKTTTDGTVTGVMWSTEDGSIIWRLDQVPRLMMQNRLTSIAGLKPPHEAFKGKSASEIITFLQQNIKQLHG